MKVRIRFSKQGSAKFIGHLDVMRYFQKVMRRAEVSIRYSGGFSPHQIMSFAAPLGVGITSNGEYLDIEVEDMEDLSTMKERMDQTMAEGFRVESCRRLPDKADNAMSIVAAAAYTVSFRPGYEPEDPKKWLQELEAFYGREHIPITKKTKKGYKELDLKPLVYTLQVRDAHVYMLLSAGSAENVKPELVLDAFYQSRGEERPPFAFLIQREDVYAEQPDGEDPKARRPEDIHGGTGVYNGRRFISLEELGEGGEEALTEGEETVHGKADHHPLGAVHMHRSGCGPEDPPAQSGTGGNGTEAQ